MRPTIKNRLLACTALIAVSGMAAPAFADTVFVDEDSTFGAPPAGDGVVGPVQGDEGGPGVLFTADDVTVINNTTISGAEDEFNGGDGVDFDGYDFNDEESALINNAGASIFGGDGRDAAPESHDEGGDGGHGVEIDNAFFDGEGVSLVDVLVDNAGMIAGGAGGDGSANEGDGHPGGDGGNGIDIWDSEGWILNADTGVIAGGQGGQGGDSADEAGDGGEGGNAIEIDDSDIFIDSAGTIAGGRGGDGGSADFPYFSPYGDGGDGGDGGRGIEFDGSDVNVTNSGADSITGGDGGDGGDGSDDGGDGGRGGDAIIAYYAGSGDIYNSGVIAGGDGGAGGAGRYDDGGDGGDGGHGIDPYESDPGLITNSVTGYISGGDGGRGGDGYDEAGDGGDGNDAIEADYTDLTINNSGVIAAGDGGDGGDGTGTWGDGGEGGDGRRGVDLYDVDGSISNLLAGSGIFGGDGGAGGYGSGYGGDGGEGGSGGDAIGLDYGAGPDENAFVIDNAGTIAAGAGGDGGNSASDRGGDGGGGGDGIDVYESWVSIINSSLESITGGDGGVGGDAGDEAGDGGDGGNAIEAYYADVAIENSGVIAAGDGGAGGNGTGTWADGGEGGDGGRGVEFEYMYGSITNLLGASLLGGDGGAGGGGSGDGGDGGDGGHAVELDNVADLGPDGPDEGTDPDVIAFVIDNAGTIAAGAGGAGGAGADEEGGDGGEGGVGIDIWQSWVSIINSGALSIHGGDGAAGGGSADEDGGDGGEGGNAVEADESDVAIANSGVIAAGDGGAGGVSGNEDGGDGGDGGRGVELDDVEGSITNTGAASGISGGAGGAGGAGADEGGDGGDGGDAIELNFVTGPDEGAFVIDNAGTIAAGAGGAGGVGTDGEGGDGGDGGVGIDIWSSWVSGVSIINSGTLSIRGGAGGAGAAGADFSGDGGDGGNAIEFDESGGSIANTGVIAGGVGGNGGAGGVASNSGAGGDGGRGIELDVVDGPDEGAFTITNLGVAAAIIGGDGGNGATGYNNYDSDGRGGDGGHAIEIDDSFFSINSSGLIAGGNGGFSAAGGDWGGDGGDGGNGIDVDESGGGFISAGPHSIINSGAITGGIGRAGSYGGGEDDGDGGRGGDGGNGINVNDVWADNDGPVAFSILNSGSITAGAGGAGGAGGGGSNGNQGGDGGVGIMVEDNWVAITNTGTITAGAAGASGTGEDSSGPGTQGAGVWFDEDGDSRLTNSGGGDILGLAGFGVMVDDDIDFILNTGAGSTITATTGTAIRVGDWDGLNMLTNSAGGVISATTGTAIWFEDQSWLGDDTINNIGGTITSANPSVGDEEEPYGTFVWDNAGLDEGELVIDGGTISNTSGVNTGVAIWFDPDNGDDSLWITAGTTVRSDGAGGADSGAGIAIEMPDDVEDVDIEGTIFGRIVSEAGNGIAVNIGDGGSLTGGVTGNDDGGFFELNIDEGGYFYVTQDSYLGSDEGSDDSVFNNAGTLQLGADRTLTTSRHNAFGTTYGVDIANNDDDEVINGLLNVTDDNVDFGGADFFANVFSDTFVADGAALLFADGVGDANLDEAGVDNVDDNSFLLDFNVVRGDDLDEGDASQVYLMVTNYLADLGGSEDPNSARVGSALEELGLGGGEYTDEVLLALMNATSQEEVDEILAALVSTLDGGAITTLLNFTNDSLDVVDWQLADLRINGDQSRGVSAGNNGQGARVWGQAFGSTANRDSDGSMTADKGYDADGWGFAAGIDTRAAGHNSVVGLAFSYAQTDVDSDNVNQTNTEVDSYQLTAYGEVGLGNNSYANAMIGYVWGQNDTDRMVLFGGTVTGDYDSDLFAARAEVGHDVKSGDMTFTPSLLANYATYSADDYSETGIGGLNVSTEDVDLFELGIGADISWDMKQTDGGVFRPNLAAGWRYDFIADEVQTMSSFISGPSPVFLGVGASPDENKFNLGAGVKYIAPGNWELTANYGFDFSENYDAHSGMVRAGFRF